MLLLKTIDTKLFCHVLKSFLPLIRFHCYQNNEKWSILSLSITIYENKITYVSYKLLFQGIVSILLKKFLKIYYLTKVVSIFREIRCFSLKYTKTSG